MSASHWSFVDCVLFFYFFLFLYLFIFFCLSFVGTVIRARPRGVCSFSVCSLQFFVVTMLERVRAVGWLLTAVFVCVFVCLCVCVCVCNSAKTASMVEDAYIFITAGFGITVSFVLILNTHDYLGIRREMLYLTFLGIFSFTAWIIFTQAIELENNNKRVLYFAGFAMLISGYATVSIYFPFFRYGVIKRIRKLPKTHRHEAVLSKVHDSRYKQMLKILANKRSYNVFRRHLAKCMCLENLEYFVICNQFRREFELARQSGGIHFFFYFLFCFLFLNDNLRNCAIISLFFVHYFVCCVQCLLFFFVFIFVFLSKLKK